MSFIPQNFVSSCLPYASGGQWDDAILASISGRFSLWGIQLINPFSVRSVGSNIATSTVLSKLISVNKPANTVTAVN